jgi:hypothetical protein
MAFRSSSRKRDLSSFITSTGTNTTGRSIILGNHPNGAIALLGFGEVAARSGSVYRGRSAVHLLNRVGRRRGEQTIGGTGTAQRVSITPGASGIGKEIATAFVAIGAKVCG